MPPNSKSWKDVSGPREAAGQLKLPPGLFEDTNGARRKAATLAGKISEYRGVQYPLTVNYRYDSGDEEDSDEPSDSRVSRVISDYRLERQNSKPESTKARRSGLRPESFLDRLARHRRNSPGTAGASRPVLPPILPIARTEAAKRFDQVQSSLGRLNPFLQARVPGIPGLGSASKARAGGQQVENAGGADGTWAPQVPAKKRFMDTVSDWYTSVKRWNDEDRGVWLCTICRACLDIADPLEKDRANIEAMRQRLRLRPPFKRVPGVSMRMRKCARCHNSCYATLFARFEAE